MLAAFKKPLVTCVKGEVSGFGLRILPLFDMVWSSSNTIFNANHDSELIEGCAVLSSTDKLNYNTVSIQSIKFNSA